MKAKVRIMVFSFILLAPAGNPAYGSDSGHQDLYGYLSCLYTVIGMETLFIDPLRN
jgi:hypothetical protein